MRIPQKMEPALFLLPRFLLNRLEIAGDPGRVTEEEFSEVLAFWRSRRVALVRQTAYPGAYQPGVLQNWPETVLTAPAHLGPFSFLAELRAEYFVVRQGREPETFLWKEKYSGDPNPQVAFAHIQAWQEKQAGSGVVDADEVAWNQYDLVVCLDVPVPSRIVARTGKTVWAYYSVEAGGRLHKHSLRRPVTGYHLYLNHGFRRFRSRPRNRPHVLEFPFTFQSSDAWRALAAEVGSLHLPRREIIVERLSWHADPGEKPGAMHLLSGNAREVVRAMTTHQFAVRTDPKTRWGNWPLEAVQAGCLFLGRADSLAMPGVLLPGLMVPDLRSAHAKTQNLLQDSPLRERLARTQAALAEHLAFRRPLAELTRFMKKLRPL